MFHKKDGGGEDSKACVELVEGGSGQERAFNLYRFPPTSGATVFQLAACLWPIAFQRRHGPVW